MARPEHGRWVGICLIVTSALGFASIGPLGKVAYRGGFSVVELQLLRFLAAAPVLGVAAAATGRSTAGPRLGGSTRLRLLALGFVGYGVQATLYFTALTRISASLTSLLLYLYPALVAGAAVAVGRHRLDRATLVGLVLIFAGTALVLGLPTGRSDPIGVGLGVGSALWYTAYLLVGERLAGGTDPLVVAAHVTVGATLWFALGLLALRPDLGNGRGSAVAAGLAMAMVGTAVPIAALFAGMARVGVTWASIGSALEPVAAVALAVVFLGEDLGPGTVLGGTAVVLGAVVLPLLAGRSSAP
ncbi:MAG: Permease of the drug/metabolite transporter (DMT) superfamily [uncultured Acidimicrobiales bacterium]|uniref:Permease of the drug/metabolite transporter (DMT) superfamily n=1 Tax=uncultured Acidimicrobiales bacterium TaxID=310071 RepID=A0A6J4IZM3_9ACTN|nr:MAG: Permease of the drug/metabolite transporter (DMT) superfamily [uncultured Acidimicrobiales bacterium]